MRSLTANPYTHPLLDAPALVAPLRLLVIGGAVALWAWTVPRARAATARICMAECLLALPLILLASPLAEDIHFCLLAPALAVFAYLALVSRPPNVLGAAKWAPYLLALLFLVMCLPRLQEVIYPDHLLTLPGQSDPRLGPLVVLLRSGALLWVVALTLVLGAGVLRSPRGEVPLLGDNQSGQDAILTRRELSAAARSHL